MLNRKLAFLLIIVSFFCLAETQIAKAEDKKNVLDYYKFTPSNAFDNKAMMAKLVVKDIKNGYLKIEGAFEGFIEVALFRKKDGSGILIVGETECGPVCGTGITAYEYVGKEMKDVTESVMPKITEDEVRAEYRKIVNNPKAEMVSYVYELPRKGRTIKILDDESGKLVYSLKLKKGKFEVSR